MRPTSLGVAKEGNLKLVFMAKNIGINFFEFGDMFRCYRDNENLKKHFGHMDTLIMACDVQYHVVLFPD